MWVVVYCKSFVSAFIMNRNLSEHLTQCTVFQLQFSTLLSSLVCIDTIVLVVIQNIVTPCTYKVKALAKGKVSRGGFLKPFPDIPHHNIDHHWDFLRRCTCSYTTQKNSVLWILLTIQCRKCTLSIGTIFFFCMLEARDCSKRKRLYRTVALRRL